MTRIQEVLELLDPADEDQLMLLLEARHAELGDALRSGQESTVDGGPVNPRLHLAMHQGVANQLPRRRPTRYVAERAAAGRTGTTSCT